MQGYCPELAASWRTVDSHRHIHLVKFSSHLKVFQIRATGVNGHTLCKRRIIFFDNLKVTKKFTAFVSFEYKLSVNTNMIVSRVA